jgi:hypothetical protein
MSGATETSGDGGRAQSKAKCLLLALFVAAAGLMPYLLHREQEFRNDDVVMVAHGARGGLVEAALACLTKPWLDTEIVQFYRPLYSLHYVVEARLFGAEAWPYYAENIAWQGAALFLGTLLLIRLIGLRGALLGGLFFALSPWAVNNVAWLVGRCTTVATVFIFLTAHVHLRRMDRGKPGLPWTTMCVFALGVFYRETALFGVILVALIDILEGRRDLRAGRNWAFIAFPFIVYLGARRAVLGTFTGGYARLKALIGWSEGSNAGMLTPEDLSPLLQLVVPGSGAHPNPAWGGLDLLLFGAVILLLLAWRPRGRRAWGVVAIFISFVALHAFPLLVVDASIQGGNAQRWHTVIWALGGLLGALAAHSRWSLLGTLMLLALTLHGAVLSWQWLDHHEDSAALIAELRREIAAGAGEVTVVHNVRPYDGTTVFFEAGLGLFGRPPFARPPRAIYPVAFEARFVAGDAQKQTPLALALRARGREVDALWIDWEARRVQRLGPGVLDAATAALAAMPRLQGASVSRDARGDFVLSWSVPAETTHCSLHLLTPLAESQIRLQAQDERIRVAESGAWSFRDSDLGELARFGAAGPGGEVFFWIVAYAEGREVPLAVSELLPASSP